MVLPRVMAEPEVIPETRLPADGFRSMGTSAAASPVDPLLCLPLLVPEPLCRLLPRTSSRPEYRLLSGRLPCGEDGRPIESSGEVAVFISKSRCRSWRCTSMPPLAAALTLEPVPLSTGPRG